MNSTITLASAYLLLSIPIRRRGFKRFMRIVNKLFPVKARERYSVSLSNGQKFGCPAGDSYWLYYLLTGEPYEMEISQLLARIPTPALFLDCGANFGYWSVMNAPRMRSVAVEASSETFDWLRQNQWENSDSFDVLHAAVTDGDAPFVFFSMGGNSAGRHISDVEDRSEKIPAISVDALVQKYLDTADGPILVKLDVEGFEIDAFKGATETLKTNSVFVYEDHGKDWSCAPTAFLLDSGRRVYAISPDKQFRRVFSLEEVRRIKTSPYVGYNFVTLGDGASDDWLQSTPPSASAALTESLRG